MKIIIFLMISLIFLIEVFGIILEKEESTDFSGREIKIEAIKESKILVSVDGETSIVSVNQTKEIKGVKVSLIEIFYMDDLSTVTIEAELSYECGDNKCDVGETSSNCCEDCGCTGNEKCSSDGCIIPECMEDVECDDNNNLTSDFCSDYKCKYREIRCEEDKDCDDNDPDTDDICDKGNCRNFLNYVCKLDIDCDDNDPCTIDRCVNKDCKSEIIEDCEGDEEEEIQEVEEEKVSFLVKLFNWLKGVF